MRMASPLWFDVGFKTYTTRCLGHSWSKTLWFDVGFKTYTTFVLYNIIFVKLWFDVGFKTYTTSFGFGEPNKGCGLM